MLAPVLEKLDDPPVSDAKDRQRASTAWLDGLRGYAALLVFICHFCMVYWSNLRYAWGTVLPKNVIVSNGTYVPFGTPARTGTNITQIHPDQNKHIIQLPIIRLLTDGDPMVVIFFIVSGYSLSIKPLTLIRQGTSAHAQLLTSLSSSIIRRPIRLLLPILISSFLVMIATRLGFYNHAATFASTSASFHIYFKGWAFEATPRIAPTLHLQFRDWFYSMYDLLDFFTHFHWTMSRYDIHLWTIPVEFRCSLFLYLTFAGTALMTPSTRLSTLAVFIPLSLSWGDDWPLALFWTGMFLAELDMEYPPLPHQPSSPTSITSSSSPSPSRLSKTHLLALLTSLYLLSTPLGWAWSSPFFSLLGRSRLPGLRTPDQSRLWQCLGATGLVATVSRSLALRSSFSNGPARYLGRVSYSLYLVHGPVLRCVGYSTAFTFWALWGRDTALRYNAAVAVAGVVVLPVTIAAAEGFERWVDAPVVRLARGVEGWVTAREGEGARGWEEQGLRGEGRRWSASGEEWEEQGEEGDVALEMGLVPREGGVEWERRRGGGSLL